MQLTHLYIKMVCEELNLYLFNKQWYDDDDDDDK